MISFKDRTKPDRKKIMLLDSGETFHAEFAAPDPGFEGSGETGTPLNAAVFTEIYSAIAGAQTLAADASAQVQQTAQSIDRLKTEMTDEFKRTRELQTLFKTEMTDEFKNTRELIQTILNLTQNLNDFLSQGMTAEEFDLLPITAKELDELGISAMDLDYKSQIYLSRRS